MTRAVALAVLAAVLIGVASFAPMVEPRAPESMGRADAGPAGDAPDPATALPDEPTVPAPDASETSSGSSSESPGVPTTTSPEGFLVVAEAGPVVGFDGPVWTYTVEVEPAAGVSPDEVLEVVDHALLEPDRGWTASGVRRLQRIDDPAGADIRVVLATPAVVDAHCGQAGIETNGAYSCWDGSRAMLNLRRWTEGAVPIPDLDTYRTYLVNHEVGHGLGFDHVDCPGSQQPAPVMMQQTKSTGACVGNGWPETSAG